MEDEEDEEVAEEEKIRRKCRSRESGGDDLVKRGRCGRGEGDGNE